MIRFLLRILFLTLFVIVLGAGAAGTWYLHDLVVLNPGHEIDEDNIRRILGKETPVFYSDASTRLGVFFGEAHRKYLTFEQVPPTFVDALVAAEDDHFFYHFGIYLPGIIRSAIANYRAGRVVQGGSTITQQTAKNLFKRRARTYRAKLKELLYALRLEYRYPKEKIFEFYVNQFYVNGNGLGLGVAARYYFDKKPAELSLLECAFIAGSVKRPSYYNPFIKKDWDRRQEARRRAKQRAAYVLGRMLELGMISQGAYQAAMAQDLEFKRGKTAYALNSAMDLVREGLGTRAVADALEAHGIDNVATSGVRIVTTLDKPLQDATLHALRKELSRLDVRLRGYDPDQVQQEYAALKYGGDTEALPGNFLFGRIVAIMPGSKDKPPELVVSLDHKQGSGVIDRQGLETLLAALVRWRDNRWAKPKKRDLDYLLQRLRIGDRVWVSVRERDEEGRLLLDLERYPLVEGGAMIMRRGAVRAMAGGAANRYYNRAIYARRPMGSTFKPLLFAAAMQLGWNPADPLSNRRDVFVFQGQAYFPRPDHHSPFDQVSMSWAGVKSENLAAVWLLYHLTDKLSLPQLRDLAAGVDMAPRRVNGLPEPMTSYRARIRDRFGIQINREILREAAYDEAVRTLEADFLFEDRAGEYGRLQRLHYGRDFDLFRKQIHQALSQRGLTARERNELGLRLDLLSPTYLELRRSLEDLRVYARHVEMESRAWDLPAADLDSLDPGDGLTGPDPFAGTGTEAAEDAPAYPVGQLYLDEAGRYVYSLRTPREAWTPVLMGDMISRFASDPFLTEAFWDEVLVEGELSAHALDMVAAQMESIHAELTTRTPYSFEVLAAVRDFRVLLGLRYLLDFSRACGLDSKLEPVLSFPLGSNVVSLIEEVRLYESLNTGISYRFLAPEMRGTDRGEEAGAAGKEAVTIPNEPEEELSDGLAIIDRIETPEGEVIYQRKVRPHRVLDARISLAVNHILENTVTYGTGNWARKHVRLHSEDPEVERELARLDLPVPLLGKTGTANRYTNSAFFGFVPGLAWDGESELSIAAGSSVGAYVGFDDNTPMKHKDTRISGSGGALRVWSRMAEALLRYERVGDRIDRADLSFNGLALDLPDMGQVLVGVDRDQGGRVPARGVTLYRGPGGPAILTFGRLGPEAVFEPQRIYMPYWKSRP